MPEKYLTATQVAEILQLNVETVYDMVNDGELSATKVHGRWRFDLSELREVVQNIPRSRSSEQESRRITHSRMSP